MFLDLKDLFVKPDSLVVALQLAPVSGKEQGFIATAQEQLVAMDGIWEAGAERRKNVPLWSGT